MLKLPEDVTETFIQHLLPHKVRFVDDGDDQGCRNKFIIGGDTYQKPDKFVNNLSRNVINNGLINTFLSNALIQSNTLD